MPRLRRLCPNPTNAPAECVAEFLVLDGSVADVAGVPVETELLPGPEGTRLFRVHADVEDASVLALLPQMGQHIGQDPLFFLVGERNLLMCDAADDESALLGYHVAWEQYTAGSGLSPVGYVRRDARLERHRPTPGHLAANADRRAHATFGADQWNAQTQVVRGPALAAGVWVASCYAGPQGPQTSLGLKQLGEIRVAFPPTEHVSLVPDGGEPEQLTFDELVARAGDALKPLAGTFPQYWRLDRAV